MKFKILIILVVSGFFHLETFGQADGSKGAETIDRLYTGGGFGLSFNRDVFSISASPILGFMLTERLSAGVAVPYQFTNYSFLNRNTNDYGARLFGRFNFTQKFFAYTEYEYLNFQFLAANPADDVRQGFDSYFFGLGYAVQSSFRSQFNVKGLYNFAWQDNKPSPYNSPWGFRFEITVALGGNRGFR